MKTSIILILIIALFSSCNRNGKSDAYGNFEAVETIISAEANGKLLNFKAEKGSMLFKNDMVGLIDTMDFYLQKKLLQAQKETIETKTGNIVAQMAIQAEQKQNMEKELERVRNLLQDGAATQKQFDDMEASIKVIERQMESIRTQNSTVFKEIEAIDWQIRQVERNISKCKIINPIKGIVLETYIEPNELVLQGKSLYKIADMSTLELRAYISGAQLPHIKIGQKVEVYIDKDNKENQKMEGIVTWISTEAEFTPKTIQTKEERVTQVYAILVKVNNDGSIKIGMPGEVIFLNE